MRHVLSKRMPRNYLNQKSAPLARTPYHDSLHILSFSRSPIAFGGEIWSRYSLWRKSRSLFQDLACVKSSISGNTLYDYMTKFHSHEHIRYTKLGIDFARFVCIFYIHLMPKQFAHGPWFIINYKLFIIQLNYCFKASVLIDACEQQVWPTYDEAWTTLCSLCLYLLYSSNA